MRASLASSILPDSTNKRREDVEGLFLLVGFAIWNKRPLGPPPRTSTKGPDTKETIGVLSATDVS